MTSAPPLMRLLGVLGTVAMFLVGGGILVHGWPALHHGIEALAHLLEQNLPGAALWSMVWKIVAEGLVGVVAGALVLLAVMGVSRLKPTQKA